MTLTQATRLAIVLAITAMPCLAQADNELPPPPPPAPASESPAPTAAVVDSLTPDQRTIWTVQHMSVREIDSTRTEVRFDRWFWNAVGADAWVTWEVNDCGEQTGSPADSARDFPMCVEAKAKWDDGREAFLWIAVGTFQTGVRGKPELAYAAAGRDDKLRTFHSLAQFAKYAQIEGKLLK